MVRLTRIKHSYPKATWILLIGSAFLFVYQFLVFISAGMDVGFFDIVLSYLSQNYATNGFIPFKDFALVYPPGNYIFIGKIIPFRSIVDTNFFYGIVYLFLLMISVSLLKRLVKVNFFLINISIYLLLNIILLRIFFHSTVFSFTTPSLIIFLNLIYLNYKNYIYLFFAAALTLVGVWFRWDWYLGMVLVNWGVLFCVFVYSKYFAKIYPPSRNTLGVSPRMNAKCFPLRRDFAPDEARGEETPSISSRELHKENKELIKRQLHNTVALTLGYFSGAIILIVYLSKLGVLVIAKEFIFTIPMILTKTYRNLPLPIPSFGMNPDLLIYLSFIFLFILIHDLIKKIKGKNISTLVLITSLILVGNMLVYLPYAFGRSDWGHFIPMWYMIAIGWIFFVGQYRYSLFKYLTIFILFLPLTRWYITDPSFLNYSPNLASRLIENQIKDCRDKIGGVKPSSVFVGRITYERYLYNVASLYFVNPDIKPATRFITEEPGIQSSCKYGQMVVDDLILAKRPMLAFLEEGLHPSENVYTSAMSSCGKIEEYLGSQRFDDIGDCQALGLNYQIRLYK